MLIVSLGMAAVFATMVIAATAGVSDNEQGLASGLFNTTQQVGSGLVLAIVAAISSARAAELSQQLDGSNKAAITGGLQYALFACASFALLAGFAALFVIRANVARAYKKPEIEISPIATINESSSEANV